MRQALIRDDPRVKRQLAALANAGYEVDVVCLRALGEDILTQSATGWALRLPIRKLRGSKTRYLVEYGGFFAGALMAVSGLHLLRGYDAIQVHNVPDVLVFSAVLPRVMGTPVVLDMTEVVPELVQSKLNLQADHPWVRVASLLERLSTRFASRVIAVSEPAREAAFRRGLTEAKTLTVRNTPDPSLFPPHRPAPREVVDECLIVSHGTLVHRYGFDLIVDAMPTIRQALPNSRLTILGDGPSREALLRQVDAKGLSEVVHLPGQVPLDQVARQVGHADIGVVANRQDPFTDLVIPTKLMEYAILGVPVVAARTVAIERWIRDGVSLFRPNDPEDLARAVIEAVCDRAERLRLALRAQEIVLGEWSWQKASVEYVRFIDEMATT